MYFLTIRRFLKWNFRHRPVAKREKLTSTFSESISEAPRLRKRCVHPWIFLLLISVLYFFIYKYPLVKINQSTSGTRIPVRLHAGSVKANKSHSELSIADYLPTRTNLKIRTITKIVKPKRIPIRWPISKSSVINLKSVLTLPKTNVGSYVSNLALCSTSNKDEDVTVMPSFSKSEPSYQDVKMGGYYQPKDCKAKHKVALLVPYRAREMNLAIFMFNIHSFLIKQKLEYRIFVIEQSGKSKFNKGRLYNAGFKEMQNYGNWQCVVFHDVDLLPLDNRIKYSCPVFPRHMCGTVVEKKKIHENSLFGGVTQMSLEHFKLVNGYSNNFWGWGGEDHDMFFRLHYSRLPILKYNKSIARFAHIVHPKAIVNPERYKILDQYLKHYKRDKSFTNDGLSTIAYETISTKLRHLYTHIIVNINFNIAGY